MKSRIKILCSNHDSVRLNPRGTTQESIMDSNLRNSYNVSLWNQVRLATCDSICRLAGTQTETRMKQEMMESSWKNARYKKVQDVNQDNAMHKEKSDTDTMQWKTTSIHRLRALISEQHSKEIKCHKEEKSDNIQQLIIQKWTQSPQMNSTRRQLCWFRVTWVLYTIHSGRVEIYPLAIYEIT